MAGEIASISTYLFCCKYLNIHGKKKKVVSFDFMIKRIRLHYSYVMFERPTVLTLRKNGNNGSGEFDFDFE